MKIRTKIHIATWFFLLLQLKIAVAAPSVITEAPTTHLTLKEAISKSFEYSKSFKIADSAYQQAVENYKKARSSLFPTLNFVGSGYTQQNPSSSPVATTSGTTTSGTTATGTYSGSQSYSAALQLTQPLYEGGGLTSGLDYYQAQIDLAKENLFNAKQTVTSQTVSAYYNLLQSQQLYSAAVQNRDILKTFLDITTGYTNIGRNRQIDKIQAKVNYQLSLADTDSAMNSRAVNNVALKILWGENSETVYEVDEAGFAEMKYQIPSSTKAVEMSLAQNPAVRIARLQEATIVASEGIDLAADRPSLNLVGSGGYTSSDLSNLFVPGAQNFRAGLVLTIPLFSGLSSIYKSNSYQDQIYQAKRNEELVGDSLKQQTVTALKNADTFKRELEMAEESVTESRLGLQIANSGFKKGIVSNVDVINIQNTNYNAEKLLVSSQVSFLQNILSLRQTLGTDLEDAYTKGDLSP